MRSIRLDRRLERQRHQPRGLPRSRIHTGLRLRLPDGVRQQRQQQRRHSRCPPRIEEPHPRRQRRQQARHPSACRHGSGNRQRQGLRQRPTPDRGNRPYRKRPKERHFQADQHHPHRRAEQQRRHLHPCRLHRRDKQQGGRQPAFCTCRLYCSMPSFSA